MNPLTLISGFSLQAKLLVVAGIAISSFIGGWQVHGWRTQSKVATSLTKQIKTSDKLATVIKQEAKQAQIAVAETKIIYRTIKEKINHENDTRICFADATALGLWNDAIAGKNTDRPSPASEATAVNTVATVENVLANAVDNFHICKDNSINHNALIDTIEALSDTMCVCQP